jgi:hypothetical protein
LYTGYREIFCKARGRIGVTIGKIFVLVYFMYLGGIGRPPPLRGKFNQIFYFLFNQQSKQIVCAALHCYRQYRADLEIVLDAGNPVPSNKTKLAETFGLISHYFVVNMVICHKSFWEVPATFVLDYLKCFWELPRKSWNYFHV